ncbi:DUF433 domain-containing protein [Floridanema evergladense]|uniref:DUF433 domain-containing protein n=1 Tax=Floridaenema evergladense BLCC-F167 TaxID=3153639 RepID=A0ABV4WVQ7_9CYAN
MKTMQGLKDYFDFQRPDDIRVKGTRVGIEHILNEYIHNHKTPEEIEQSFSTVTLEQVYATILYYLANKETVGQYFQDWLDYCEKAEAEYDKNPPPFVAKLRELKAQKKLVSEVEQI